MKHRFTVARNVFTVSVDETLPAWRILERRFAPFADSSAERPVLEIDVRLAPLPEYAAERIYEPVYDGIGMIAARASRLPDGSLVMEFRNVSGSADRLSMRMSPGLDRADVTVAPGGDGKGDSYFLTHALMLAFMLATAGNGTLLIHASCVVADGRAYMFQGKSGTGKSTHASMWTKYISGAELLNDDHPVIRFSEDDVAMAYGSPWSGKTHCYRNLSAPIGAFVRIIRAKENELRPLSPLEAYASLTASVFFLPFLSERLREVRHLTIERLVAAVPCCEMHCRPDAEAAVVCCDALSEYI